MAGLDARDPLIKRHGYRVCGTAYRSAWSRLSMLRLRGNLEPPEGVPLVTEVSDGSARGSPGAPWSRPRRGP